MSAQVFVPICIALSMVALSAAMALTIFRIAIGPTAADRLLGFAMLLMAGLGLIAAVAVRTGIAAYIDVMFVMSLMLPLSMVAGARLLGPGADVTEPGEGGS